MITIDNTNRLKNKVVKFLYRGLTVSKNEKVQTCICIYFLYLYLLIYERKLIYVIQ